MGGILKPDVPDNSAITAEINKQEDEAKRHANEEKARLNLELLTMRQRRFGRSSLVGQPPRRISIGLSKFLK
tara:strand:+ start:171 stop:386 length:216 start_codon:yes stop_codon:yes gene_type:complete